MIRAMIIEDERVIAGELKRELLHVAADLDVIACACSVKESLGYLASHEAPDLIFSDVQLSDGLSFEIFNTIELSCPVIFITGYEHFMIHAFESNGIDYLLKPVDAADLRKALDKFRRLQRHFSPVTAFSHLFQRNGRNRLIAKKGRENIAIKAEDIAVIYTEDKLVYLLDREGRKYRIDKTLGELESDLDRQVFFRANRQYIINVAFVRCYKSYEKVKLQVELSLSLPGQPIVVSQEMAPVFKRWIGEY